MAHTILFTGFPGFLGRELLWRVLERGGGREAVCLVQGRYRAQAEQAQRQIEQEHPSVRGRIRLVEGDIVQPDLGLGAERDALARQVKTVVHLAAVYDLAVGRELAFRVNVDGTRHVLDFAARCPSLERHHYVSTCYVSGRHAGIFRERDLEKGQRFNNFYEETKHLAEVEVRRRWDTMPTTIYRPSIVVGDSTTGATQKYDGPYFAIRWLLRQKTPIVVMPQVGDPTAIRFNVVPRDFVVNAMAHLYEQPGSVGQCYQLADPEPLTVREQIDVMQRELGKPIVGLPLPLSLARGAIEHLPPVERFFGFPPHAIDYFVHPTHYDTTSTDAALAGSGIACPGFESYVGRLFDFVRQHPDITSQAMV